VQKYKYVVKMVAHLNGKTATFMPKPLYGDNGSGMHVHQSIWKDGKNLFFQENAYANLSDLARHYIGGVLRHARSVAAFTNPSTNSYKEGFTKSESSVGKTFDAIFSKAKGRVIMSTFSSNIHRVYQAIEWGLKYNRKVCVIGRSMERNLYTAMELGYIKLDKKIFIDANEVGKFKDDEVLIVTTGSQGETMSALYRMATDEHKYIKIKPTDQIIISSKAIPGNENSVSTVLNFLLKSGASVAYQDFSEIHVSGHAAQEEQKLMLRLIKLKLHFQQMQSVNQH